MGVFAMAKSLPCATHVKSLSRHKVLQIDAAVDAAPWPFMAAPVAVEERNLHKARDPVRGWPRISLYRRFYMYMGLITLILAGIAVIAIVAINLTGKR